MVHTEENSFIFRLAVVAIVIRADSLAEKSLQSSVSSSHPFICRASPFALSYLIAVLTRLTYSLRMVLKLLYYACQVIQLLLRPILQMVSHHFCSRCTGKDEMFLRYAATNRDIDMHICGLVSG